MMDYTDRHERYFLRLISKDTWLFTEMLTANTVIHGDCDRLLAFNKSEHPLTIQLGGSEPRELAKSCKIAYAAGYDEVNLNVGCPSDRVKSGRFGACLMAEPALVANCIAAMNEAVSIPVTVKCRLGIDNQDDYDNLADFVRQVSAAGCQEFIVHARKAWLQGLSPKENRNIPPLRYDLVYRLKREFPHLFIIINGGITSLTQTLEHLKQVDGVMIGREAYSNPYMLADADKLIFERNEPIVSRKRILQAYLNYVENCLQEGTALTHLSRHILGLFQGTKGAKAWRRHISENAHKPGAGVEVIKEAAIFVGLDL